MNNTYRIIDANINRMSEGIRVLEDHSRFITENKDINSQLRDIRHKARKILKEFDNDLISSRESLTDNGLKISSENKLDNKTSEKSLILSNFKRVQEAVRSIEENLKIIGEYDKGKQFEQIRFEVYDIEKQCFSSLKFVLPEGIYGLTAEIYSNGRSNIEVVKEMITAGIKIIQYREKEEDKSKKEMLAECLDIREMTKEENVVFIVNDHLDIAILCKADGIHLGQDDLTVQDIKQINGNLIIGVSTHNPEQAQKAISDGADYIGVGPIFSTKTKKNVCDPVGLEYLEYIVNNIDIPFVAIGGIKEDNIHRVIEKGAKSIALVTEIVGAENIGDKIKNLNNKLK
ncbi:MAG: thiamine phosphate synthase [Candidatus Delongbacteria bacterium]|jgi:thiamine-phosphate pyrophosphorylase|nr:thiamine phosphate synthase [Candidatus Delongbacteria bacterium]